MATDQECNPDIGQTNAGGHGVSSDPYCHKVESVILVCQVVPGIETTSCTTVCCTLSKEIHSEITMATSVTDITGFNNFKDDFTGFVKKANTDKKGVAQADLYHCLHKTEVGKKKAKRGMFDSVDLRSYGVSTFDDWYKFKN